MHTIEQLSLALKAILIPVALYLSYAQYTAPTYSIIAITKSGNAYTAGTGSTCAYALHRAVYPTNIASAYCERD